MVVGAPDHCAARPTTMTPALASKGPAPRSDGQQYCACLLNRPVHLSPPRRRWRAMIHAVPLTCQRPTLLSSRRPRREIQV